MDTAWAIQGLNERATVSQLQLSHQVHNKLVDDAKQPPVSAHDLNALAQIFVHHDVHTKFGIHLMHNHYELDKDLVNVGTYTPELDGHWTKPTHVTDVDLDDVHGHIFAFTETGSWVPYEYCAGTLPDTQNVSAEFFDDLARYLRSNGLEKLLGLEVLESDSNGNSFEFVLGNEMGTLMLNESTVYPGASANIYRTTGWVFENDGVVSFRGNTVHSQTRSLTHVTSQDAKFVTRPGNLAELKLALGAEIYA